MIVCFLHAKVGHRQAIYISCCVNSINAAATKALSMKIVRAFAFVVQSYDKTRLPRRRVISFALHLF